MELNVDDIYLIDIFTNMITTNNNQIERLTNSNGMIFEEINSILIRSRFSRRNRRRRAYDLHSTSSVANAILNVNAINGESNTNADASANAVNTNINTNIPITSSNNNTNINRNITYRQTPRDISRFLREDTMILRNTENYPNIIPNNIIPNTNARRTIVNRIDDLLQQIVNNETREREMRTSNRFVSEFEPTHLSPTRTEIENSTRLLRFSEIESPLNHQCPISLEPFNNDQYVTMLTTCNHIFNPASIEAWFQRSSCCPVCRHDIISQEQQHQEREFYIMDIIFNLTDPSSNII